jgi:uncharacterized membrane protein
MGAKMIRDQNDSMKREWHAAPKTSWANRWLNPAALVLLGYVVLALLMFWIDLKPMRVVLAIILTLLGSGYSLTAVLFRSEDLNILERLALAGGLSLAFGGVSGFALAKSHWSLAPESLLITAFLFNLLCYVGISYQRTHGYDETDSSQAIVGPSGFQWVPGANRFRDPATGRWVSGAMVRSLVERELNYTTYQPDRLIEAIKQWVLAQSMVSLAVTIVLTLLIARGGLALDQLTATTGGDPPMTEFFLLNEEGLAGDYPETVHPAETLVIRYGLANGEGETVDYRVEASVEGETIGQPEAVTLSDGETIQAEMVLAWPEEGLAARPRSHRVEFTLYRGEKRYRSLHLWLDVELPEVTTSFHRTNPVVGRD